jgi:hypothetical protein
MPFAVMAIAILALDAALNLAGAGTAAFFAAITTFAIVGGCYVGRRVVSEGDSNFESRSRRRIHRAS